MVKRNLLYAAGLAAAFLAGYWIHGGAADTVSAASRVYELRTYTAAPGKLDALHARFRDHTMKIFKQHGMENIGYWVPTDPEKSGNTLTYMIAHKSPEAAEASWKAFREDPDWQSAKEASEVDGKLVDHIERVFLSPTNYSPLR